MSWGPASGGFSKNTYPGASPRAGRLLNPIVGDGHREVLAYARGAFFPQFGEKVCKMRRARWSWRRIFHDSGTAPLIVSTFAQPVMIRRRFRKRHPWSLAVRRLQLSNSGSQM